MGNQAWACWALQGPDSTGCASTSSWRGARSAPWHVTYRQQCHPPALPAGSPARLRLPPPEYAAQSRSHRPSTYLGRAYREEDQDSKRKRESPSLSSKAHGRVRASVHPCRNAHPCQITCPCRTTPGLSRERGQGVRERPHAVTMCHTWLHLPHQPRGRSTNPGQGYPVCCQAGLPAGFLLQRRCFGVGRCVPLIPRVRSDRAARYKTLSKQTKAKR